VIAEVVPEEAMGAVFTAADTTCRFLSHDVSARRWAAIRRCRAAANVVAAASAPSRAQGAFMTFLRNGLPLTACQLVVAALYVLAMFA